MASPWLLGIGGMVVLAVSLALLFTGFSQSSLLVEEGEVKDSAVSPHALGRLLLERLQEGDLSEVAQLGLSKEEWVHHVWPVSAANRPGSNFTPDFVWGLDAARNQRDLSGTVRRYGGKRELKLFSSVFERNGEFKIFSFKNDN